MPDATEELFNDLDKNRHPDYTEREAEWKLHRAILGDEDINLREYLPPGAAEDEDLYELRLKLSQWIPESQLAIGSLVSALYDAKPQRDVKDKRLDGFMDDVDRKGMAFNDFIEKEAKNLLAYGTTRILVNIPDVTPPKEGVEPSRADEIAQDVKPFLISYSPLSVIAWDTDDRGELTMVRIKEERSALQEGKGREYVLFTKFIEYTKTDVRWWEFALIDGKRVLVAEEDKPHQIGRVPMIVENFTHEIKPMIGASFIRYAGKADVQKFQAESDLGYDTHVHAHPTFYSKTEKKPAAIGVGSAAFIHLEPDTPNSKEEVGYVDTPKSAFEALMQVIDEKRRVIYRQANTDPMGVLEAGTANFQASGVARAWAFGTSEARVLSSLAGAMKDIELDIFDVSLRIQGTEPSTPAVDVQYPEEFNLASVDELINQLESIAEQVNSPTLLRQLHKRIAAAKLGDASRELHKKIFDEIDNNELLNTAVGKEQPEVENVLNFEREGAQ